MDKNGFDFIRRDLLMFDVGVTVIRTKGFYEALMLSIWAILNMWNWTWIQTIDLIESFRSWIENSSIVCFGRRRKNACQDHRIKSILTKSWRISCRLWFSIENSFEFPKPLAQNSKWERYTWTMGNCQLSKWSKYQAFQNIFGSIP